MVSRCHTRLGEFIADIFFQALQFCDVSDGQDVMGRAVHEEKVGIGNECVRRPLENRFVERWTRPFGPIWKNITHVFRRHWDAQEGRGPFIDMVNSAAFGIEDDAICNVR